MPRRTPARPRAAVSRGSRAKRQTEQSNRADDSVPEEFRELLAEAESSHPDPGSNATRPLKRRRVGEGPSLDDDLRPEVLLSDLSGSEGFADVLKDRKLQTITIDSDSDEESEPDWEDVGLASGHDAPAADAEQNDVSVVLKEKPGATKPVAGGKKSGLTAAERKMRLDVHKTYVCCLLYHNFLKNNYCNDHIAQSLLSDLVDSRISGMLRPKSTYPQMRRNALFTDGLNHVQNLWKAKFKPTLTGLWRPRWSSSIADIKNYKLPEHTEFLTDREDFREAAKTLEGSADVGALLLCALLRSTGVTTRLVCSLQPLPFTAGLQSQTSQRHTPKKTTIYVDPADSDADEMEEATADVRSLNVAPVGHNSPLMPRRIIRVGQPRGGGGATFDLGKAPKVAAPEIRRIQKPSYPVYWVEAFNEAQQKWIALDPVVTQTLGRPSRLEPPFNDAENCMTYVIAFEEDGTAKDVTRRYARAFNAKTRKLRVESVNDGDRWLRKALKLFRRRLPLDRDQVEDAELARREAAEGMPRNVQDFKNHPYYVLERHLRHNEVITPRHEVGKVNSGGAASGKLEPVYRRKDVHIVRSADKWYRHGHEIKAGEQPLKHAKPKKQRAGEFLEHQDDEEEANAGAALYAAFQTELYVPPSVVRGRVPRNAYGNLDVYVPSMVPAGGIHIKSPDAIKAARRVGVDFAEAVTGFKFQGRQGSAVVQGIVVAVEHAAAVEEVIEQIGEARRDALQSKRSAEVLRLWRRFMVGLRVVERLQEYRGNEEASGAGSGDIRDEIDRLEEGDGMAEGGGFFADADSGAPAEPTATFLPGSAASPPSTPSPPSEPREAFLPGGIELVGFEGIALKHTQRPARRLMALDDSDDDVRQEDDWRRPQALERAVPGPSGAVSSSVIVSAVEDANSQEAGGFIPEADDAEDDGAHMALSDRPPLGLDGTVEYSPSETTMAQPQPLPHDEAVGVEMPSHHEGNETKAGHEMSEDERGSLLSHDPDDDDAEPEWLEVVSD